MPVPTTHAKLLIVLLLTLAGVIGWFALARRIGSPPPKQQTAPNLAASKTSATPREQSQQASQEARRSSSPPSAAAVTPPLQANRTSHISDLKSPDGATPLALPEEARKAIQREREEGEHGPERYDEPGAAAEFYRLKRAPEGETTVPIERYLTAREQMRAMRQYSSAQASWLPTRHERQNEAQTSALGTWTPLGPGNVGGRTRALLIQPTNPSVMYAAGVAGGVWKTANGGGSWTPLADLLANIAVNSLAMEPANPNIIYAGTGEGYFNGDAVRGLGIFKTTDGGNNWTQLASTATSDFYYVNDIVISPNNSQRIYAATRTGVWRSLDGGGSWTRVLDPQVNGGCLDLAIRTDQTSDYIFASCGGAGSGPSGFATIFRNTDAGNAGTWTSVYAESGMKRTSLAIAPSNQNVIYAASASGVPNPSYNGLQAVFRSTSSGDAGTWTAQVRNTDTTKLNTVLFSNPIFAFFIECGLGTRNSFFNQGWYDNVIAVDPADANRVWVGGIDLFRSDDGGVNWGQGSHWWADKTVPQYAHADQHAIVFHPQYDGVTNKVMFVGNDGGVFRTDDARAAVATGLMGPCNPSHSAVTWTALNNNYGVTQFYHGLPYPDGTSYFGGTQDNGTLRGTNADGANGWREIFGGDGGYVAIDPTNTSTLYLENIGLSPRKSTDGGVLFGSASAGLGGSSLFIAPLVMDPSDPQRMWIGGTGIFRTTDGAAHWLPVSGVTGGMVSAIAVSPTDANYVLAGSSLNGAIYRTDTGLTSISTVWFSTGPRSGYVSGLAFDPTNRNIAYATYSTFGGAHVWRSPNANAGGTWVSIDGSGPTGLPDIPAHCIVVDPSNTTRLYIGTDLGVFVSLDSGATWAVENTGFANVVVESLALNTVNGVTSLYAFTHGRGVWRVTLSNSGCNYTLSPTGQSFGIAGGTGNVNVTATPNGCQWTTSSNADWIVVTGGGSGNGTASYSVAPNTSFAPRTGTVTMAGRTFVVTQAGNIDTTPPTVTITSPTTASTLWTNSKTIILSGTATDNVGVRIVIWMNERGDNDAASGTNSWTIGKLSLQLGVNNITVTALDASGNVGSANLKIVFIPEYAITTVAGGGTGGLGDDGLATAAQVLPLDIAFDSQGSLFIAEGVRIRKVPSNGIITTIAGNGIRGSSGDGGPATAAQLDHVASLAVDSAGNLYLADDNQHRVRKVDAQTGIITTVAGNGAPGFSGDGGLATSAQVGNPVGVATDSADNLYIATASRVRKVSSNGIITTVAGGGNAGDGVPATEAKLDSPKGLTLDHVGNLYIADSVGNLVRKVSAGTGLISTVAGGGTPFIGDGGPATEARLNGPQDVAVDTAGNLYISDGTNNRIRKVNASTGLISSIAGGGLLLGDGGPATEASVGAPNGLAIDTSGNIYFADTSHQRVRKLFPFSLTDTVAPSISITEPSTAAVYTTAQSQITLKGNASDNVAVTHVTWSYDRGGSGLASGIASWTVNDLTLQTGVNNITVTAWDANGNSRIATLTITYNPPTVLTTLAGNLTSGITGDNSSAIAAQLWNPQAVATDAAGNVYIADTQNHRLRKVTRSGIITAFAGSGQLGSTGDGGPAIAASMNEPRGVTVDTAGNVYLADSQNHRLRKVTPDGIISAFAGTGQEGSGGDGGPATAAQLDFPIGVAVDGAGNVYIADADNNRIRKVTASTGIINTIAGTGAPGFSGDGGQATAAQLNFPTSVAVNNAGNLFIADRDNQRVREIAADGTISTIAGNGDAGSTADDIPATSAVLYKPYSVAVDASGKVYLADQADHRIRKVSVSGTISTVAGNGFAGSSGEGGAATNASLYLPTGVTLDGAGNLYIADTGNHRVVVVALYASTATANAASYSLSAVASESIVSAFGAGLATTAEGAATLPLPTTLAGTTIKVRDSRGVERLAPLFYVSPGQINYLIPAGTGSGFATIFITNSQGQTSTGVIQVTAVAPGLFTANTDGQGAPAAIVVHAKPDGAQTFDLAAVFDPAQGKNIPRQIDLGPPGDVVVIELFGTGFRYRSSLDNVTATIGGVPVQVYYAGAQGNFAGLDQVNVEVPRSLIGRGEVDLVLTVDGKAANTIKIKIK